MLRVLCGLVSLFCVLVALNACSEDLISTPDVVAPVSDTVADVGDPDLVAPLPDEDVSDAVSPDAVEEDTDPRPPCVCHTEDDCCDGCYPINEGGACDDSDPCTVDTVCVEGVCGGGAPLECPPPGICQQGEGYCAETGCVYEALADGTPCEALDGVAGSGVCRRGECAGFGDCDRRSYGQPVRYPCNTSGECASGICFRHDSWRTYCTEDCGADGRCPAGMECLDAGLDEGFVCRLIDGRATLPGDGSQALYRVCNSDEDCEGGLCLAIGGEKFCTRDCQAPGGGGGDDSLCQPCGSCRDDGDAAGLEYKYYCRPRGSKMVSEGCELSLDCYRGLCLNYYCTEQCVIVAPGVDTCLDGLVCVADGYDGRVDICVDPADLDKPLGELCGEDYQCISGFCGTLLGERRCTRDCSFDPCPEGVCVVSRRDSVNTIISLWDEDGLEPLEGDDNSGEGTLSLMEYEFTESGRFAIEVHGRFASSAGYYTLTITGEDEPEELPTVREIEPNDELETAQAVVWPVRIEGRLEREDHDFYSFEVEVAGDPVILRFATGAVDVGACVPEERAGGLDYGEPCLDDFECADGRECYRGRCTVVCDPEGEPCPSGICFEFDDVGPYCVPDEVLGATPYGRGCEYDFECEDICYFDPWSFDSYCSGPCPESEPCRFGMGCFEDLCVLALADKSYLFSPCRIDQDCETLRCEDGVCRELCDEDWDCEGHDLITPEPYGICWPCRPEQGTMDCNPDWPFGGNACISGDGVEYFCATDCFWDRTSCPPGTRCYQVDWGTYVCAPLSLSCRAGSACNGDGRCVRPTSHLFEPCRETAECFEGRCERGLCQPLADCSEDHECGCAHLGCVGGLCEVVVGIGEVLEVEPNDTLETAQELSDFPVRVLGEFDPPGGGEGDVDLYKVTLSAGDVLDVYTGSFCGLASDTYIILRDADGEMLPGYANDHIAPDMGNFQSYVGDYVAESAEVVYIEVGRLRPGRTVKAGYTLTVEVFPRAPNDTCDGAVTLVEGDYDLSLEGATDVNSAAQCVGWPAPGKDLVYQLEIPEDNLLVVELWSDFDGQLYLATDCDDPNASCLVGVDLVWAPGYERLAYANETGAAQTVWLFVDSWPLLEDGRLIVSERDFALNIYYHEIVAPENDSAAGSLELTGDGVHWGTTVGAGNTYDPGEEGCADQSLMGPDVVYSFTLDHGEFMSATTESTFPVVLYVVLDPDDLSTCVASGRGAIAVANDDPGAGSRLYYLVVDGAAPEDRGVFDLEVVFGALGPCAGPCVFDPEDPVEFCVGSEASSVCYCDPETSLLTRFDCHSACVDGGRLAGTCRMVRDTPRCVCDYDCSDPFTIAVHCSWNIATSCTCSASDPCDWVENGRCDDICAEFYPDDHFDDSVDCAEEN